MDRHRIARLALWTTAIVTTAGGGAVYLAARQGIAVTAPAPIAKPTEQEMSSLTQRASAGDPEARMQLGLWALQSADRPGDYLRAAEWLRQAAESGNIEAQYRLATIYQAGRGLKQDDTNAVFWFQKAAEGHHAAALYNLGSMHEAGRGVRQDSKAAAHFMQQAAELGDAYAQYNLARRFEDGRGVTRDLVESLKWYRLADSAGLEGARNGRRALEARLSAEEQRRAERGVAEFRKGLAVKGTAEAR